LVVFRQNSIGIAISERTSSVRMIIESRESRNVLVFYEDIHICELSLLEITA
jgi:hypothetical protein